MHNYFELCKILNDVNFNCSCEKCGPHFYLLKRKPRMTWYSHNKRPQRMHSY